MSKYPDKVYKKGPVWFLQNSFISTISSYGAPVTYYNICSYKIVTTPTQLQPNLTLVVFDTKMGLHTYKLWIFTI